MENELVSILIPVYNRFEYAKEAIVSAINQDYENIEIIVVDNNSDDGTFEKLKACFSNNQKVKIFQNSNNIGPVGNWEVCLEKSNGAFIKFLWSDDLIGPRFISRGVELLNECPKASFAFSAVKIFQDTSFTSIKKLIEESKSEKSYYTAYTKTGTYKGVDYIYDYCLGHSVPVSPGCAIFRRDKVHINYSIPNAKGYDHRKTGAGIDVLMFLNAVENGEQFIYFDDMSSFFRYHPKSISISDKAISIGYKTAKLYFIKKHLLDKRYLALNGEIILGYFVKKIKMTINK